MAKVTKKTYDRFKVTLNREEMNTVTIALALLSHDDLKIEVDEQGLTDNDVVWNHLNLISPFLENTNLYPLAEVKGEENESM